MKGTTTFELKISQERLYLLAIGFSDDEHGQRTLYRTYAYPVIYTVWCNTADDVHRGEGFPFGDVLFLHMEAGSPRLMSRSSLANVLRVPTRLIRAPWAPQEDATRLPPLMEKLTADFHKWEPVKPHARAATEIAGLPSPALSLQEMAGPAIPGKFYLSWGRDEPGAAASQSEAHRPYIVDAARPDPFGP